MTDQEKFKYIKSRIAEIQSRTHPPEKKPFLDLIERTNAVLTSENKERRSYDKAGLPGGIILLKPNIPTIIVPDLHARMEYLTSILFNGEIKFGGDDDPKKGSKGNRSFVANKGNTAYIGVVHSATVAESARVMKSLGMENAMNLDNGGSTAVWSGGYKVGPGRNLPNVILFVRK